MKSRILIVAFLISLSICAFSIMQAEAATATISLSPNSGYVGDKVIVSAPNLSGFALLSSITIKFDTTTLTTIPSQVTTGFSGAFNANFTVPTQPSVSTPQQPQTPWEIGTATFTVNAPLSVAFAGSWLWMLVNPKSLQLLLLAVQAVIRLISGM
jgi:hypothetical protein